MSKNPEQRYQSAYGIYADLLECLQRLENQGKIADFQLGTRDIYEHFRLPNIMQGRQKELRSLEAAFERTAAGALELVLVSGYSGVGKTTLIRELALPVAGRGGFFIEGKFDQLTAKIPYSALAEAFGQLLRALAGTPQDELETWRNKIQRAVGLGGSGSAGNHSGTGSDTRGLSLRCPPWALWMRKAASLIFSSNSSGH